MDFHVQNNYIFRPQPVDIFDSNYTKGQQVNPMCISFARIQFLSFVIELVGV